MAGELVFHGAYSKFVSGEVSGSATAKQLPNIPAELVLIVADDGNAGNVYIGGPGVTVPDGTTDTTSGVPRAAGEVWGPFPMANLNMIYIICDNAGDDILYNIWK